MLPFVCLVTTILVSALGVQGNGIHHIVSGTSAKDGEFPHIVALEVTIGNDIFTCGGSIIDNKHVLTAAHCIDGDVKAIQVLYGSLNNLKMPISRMAKGRKHKLYKNTLSDKGPKRFIVNDVAILTLSKTIFFTKRIQPIRLANPGEKFRGDCIVAGWGRTGLNKPSPALLRKANVPLIPAKTCTSRFSNIFPEQQICAGQGTYNGRTTCLGDSGGPLMCKSAVDGVRVLAGVVSYGWECDNGVSVMAKVSHFLPWINKYRKF